MKTLWEGILIWKMPLFRGFLYATVPAMTAIYAGLQDYKAWEDLDRLTWFKIGVSAIIAAGSALGGYLDSSFTRKKDEQKAKPV